MIAFVILALLSATAVVVLADSTVRGVNAYKQLKQAARARSGGQVAQITIIEPAGLKTPAPSKLSAFNRSIRPVAANAVPLPLAA